MKNKKKFTSINAVIPASGIGKRMKNKIPKQYIKIGKKTILEHSITSLLLHKNIKNIIIVINKNDNFLEKLNIFKKDRILTAIGGKNRSESVFAGLKKIDEKKGWVLIHDAVRPFLQYKDVTRLFFFGLKNKIGSILATPLNNTIKFTQQKKIISTVNRKFLWQSLTPQLFRLEILYLCLKSIIKKNINITDDSEALEYFGYHPQLVIGRSDNIKITKPEDLNFAKFYLESKNKDE